MKPPALLVIVTAAILFSGCAGYSYRFEAGYEDITAAVEVWRSQGKQPVRVQPSK